MTRIEKTSHVYIQGCPRSGNTLMRELCLWSFCGTKLVKISKDDLECTLDLLVSPQRKWFWQKPPAVCVASRNADESWEMSLEALRAHPGVRVIWMLRNPLDVLTSIHGDAPDQFFTRPTRLIRCWELYKKFEKEPQVLTIHYEELVSNPEAVQKKITEAFGLEPIRSFTESHKFFSKAKSNLRALHSVRPIDSNSLDKWKKKPEYRDFLKKVLADFPAIIALARDCGYEIDPAVL
jgi:hypothetical protein